MERVARLRGEQAVGRDHARDVGRLHGDLDVAEAGVLEERDLPERALDERLGRRAAVAGEDVLLERAGVHADADRDAAVLRGGCDLADLGRGADVAGVDAEAVDAGLERGEGEAVVEVDVGDDRAGADGALDLRERGGRGGVGHGEADDVRAGLEAGERLRGGRGGVPRVGVRHRLDGHRRAAADLDGADADAMGGLAGKRLHG